MKIDPTYHNCTAAEFLRTISQPHIEKRIVSNVRSQDIYYSLRGTELAKEHRAFKRGKLTEIHRFLNN